jgi:hypothetical protein
VKKNICIVIAILLSITPVFADWQSALEAEFPFVQTFNNLDDWTPTGSGDVCTESYMPVVTSTQQTGVWRYYSMWSTVNGAGIDEFSHTVNPWDEATSKSLRIDLSSEGLGPSRLAADLRGGSYTNGFPWSGGVRVFYAMYRASAFWPASPTGYSKEFVLNMECNDTSCSVADDCGANYASHPYFDYHHTHENGVNPACLVSNTAAEYISEPAPRTDIEDYNDQWLFVEYLYEQYTSGTNEAQLSGWFYDANGTLLDHFYDDLHESEFTGTEWTSCSVGYFDNAMFGGNMSSTTTSSQIYYDDLIIDVDSNGAIASRYFSLSQN